LGLTFFSTGNLMLSGNYDLQHTNDSDAHIGFLRLRYKF
jgi:hypothetical protein